METGRKAIKKKKSGPAGLTKTEIARALNSFRKTHGAPPIKPGTPEEMERRRRKREAQRRWRANAKNRRP